MLNKPKYFDREYYHRKPTFKIVILGPKQNIDFNLDQTVYYNIDTNRLQEIPVIKGIDLALILIPEGSWKYLVNYTNIVKKAKELYPINLVVLCMNILDKNYLKQMILTEQKKAVSNALKRRVQRFAEFYKLIYNEFSNFRIDRIDSNNVRISEVNYYGKLIKYKINLGNIILNNNILVKRNGFSFIN